MKTIRLILLLASLAGLCAVARADSASIRLSSDWTAYFFSWSRCQPTAIRVALNAPVFYLGCLGSTRTHAKRVERLRAEGFDEDRIARIHAPVGLNIGAKSPAEIAVSILAQITQVLRQG